MLPEVNERLQQIEDVRWNIYTHADSAFRYLHEPSLLHLLKYDWARKNMYF